MDTFIDGCGFDHDRPIGEGTRIRFKLEEDRQQDITVYVEGGVLQVYGMNRPLTLIPVQSNRVDISTVKWEKP